jgi:hypothetical protein
MKFYGVDSDASPPRDLSIGHAMFDSMRDRPLGWRQDISMRRSAAAYGLFG